MNEISCLRETRGHVIDRCLKEHARTDYLLSATFLLLCWQLFLHADSRHYVSSLHIYVQRVVAIQDSRWSPESYMLQPAWGVSMALKFPREWVKQCKLLIAKRYMRNSIGSKMWKKKIGQPYKRSHYFYEGSLIQRHATLSRTNYVKIYWLHAERNARLSTVSITPYENLQKISPLFKRSIT